MYIGIGASGYTAMLLDIDDVGSEPVLNFTLLRLAGSFPTGAFFFDEVSLLLLLLNITNLLLFFEGSEPSLSLIRQSMMRKSNRGE